MTDFASESDAALILLSTTGAPEAFSVLFTRHRNRVFHHALVRLGHKEEAEDVTAVVFLEAWRKRKAIFLYAGSAIAWLLTTTNYVIANQRRATRRYRNLLDGLPHGVHVEDHAPVVLARLEAETRKEDVRRALHGLRLSDQDILTLCVIEELTTAQVSDALKIPEGTVKSRLHRAKKRLKEALPPDLALPDEKQVSDHAKEVVCPQ